MSFQFRFPDEFTHSTTSTSSLHPNERTPTTFKHDLNKYTIGNCTHDPQPQSGVSTLMGSLRDSKNKDEHDVLFEAIL